MKRLILLILTAMTLSCATMTDSQVKRLEELIEEQNRTLLEIEKDIASLEQTEGVEVSEAEQTEPQVITKIIVEDYKLGDKIIVGEKEMVYLNPPGEYFDGRIDTGATTSSLHGGDIKWFERDGKKWVSFNMNHDGVDRPVERLVIGIRSVKQTNSAEPVDRPVIKMFTQIGDIGLEIEYTLVDRSLMTFPVLIGRNLLQDLMVVDVAYEYLHKIED